MSESHLSFPWLFSPLHHFASLALTLSMDYAFHHYHLFPYHLYILLWCLSYSGPLKSHHFHLNLRVVCFTYFALGRIILFVACEFLTPSFAYFCLLSPLLFPSLDHTMVITLCLLSKISNLLSQFESGVLLTSPLDISSSLPRVSFDVAPCFVVLIPLALQRLHLFSHTLVCCRLWPLRYWGLVPKCLLWTYALKVSPFFQPSLRAVSYLTLPWFLFTPCFLTSFGLNSILCCVFYLLSPSPCHPSILPWYSSLFWLLKNLLSSTSIGKWLLTYLSLGRTLFFSICRFCLNSILCGTYILCSYAHLPPLLHSCLLSP